MIEKNKVLGDAVSVLNKDDQPWEVSVEGDCIIGKWKWMDATFFSQSKISSEVRDYTFTVTLGDNGKWKEVDRTSSKSASVSSTGAKLSASKFKGKTMQKSFEFGVGKNKDTGETGIIGFTFDTSLVKKPIREYLESCGWKKAGLFGSLR